MLKLMKARLAVSEREGGFALALVLSISLVLMLLVVTVASASVSGLKTTRSDQDSNAALAAAYAGVDEYESRLAGDSSYGQYGNPNSPFTDATGGNKSVIAPATPNTAFAVTKGGTWTTVPGSNGLSSFRYEVDNSQFSSKGVLRIRSTGRVGQTTRSVVANVMGKGFINYLYFTDYEIADPSLGPFNSTTGAPLCKPVYAYVQASRPNCTELTFAGGDSLAGPVMSNDVMHICSAKFGGTVTSADTIPPYYSPTTAGSSTTCSGQIWATDTNGKTLVPTHDSSLVIPTTNTTQLQETRTDDPQDVPRPGCLYTGPTKITLNANGTMNVISPYTKYTQSGPNVPAAAGVTLQNCGTRAALQSTAGATVLVPTNNIIYVQAVPGTVGDPNYTASGASPVTGLSGYVCYGSNTNTNTSNGAVRVPGNGIGYPTSTTVSGSFVNELPPSSTSYGCTAGDAFVQGQLHGRLTIAAANYVYITGDTVYAPADAPGVDILGLVGLKAIWIWNPILTDKKTFVLAKNRVVDAALLSLNDTFTVQNYTLPANASSSGSASRGTLTVYGSIAQKFRGGVATSSGSTIVTGYQKKYNYDQQMKTAAPPKFLAPVSTTYGTTSIAQVAAGFLPDGTAVSVVK
jgi:Tfp pilus assembly protein PilX